MRILLVTHQFFPEFSSGTERVALQLARVLQHGGHAVRVLTSRSAPPLAQWRAHPVVNEAWDYLHDGVPVTAIARSRLPAAAEFGFDVDATQAAEWADWLKRERFHIAHVLHPMRMATVVMAIQQAGLPYVVTMTDFFFACHQINLVNVQGEVCRGPEQGRRCARDCRVGIWTEKALATRHRQAHAILAGAALRCVPSHYVQSRAEAAFGQLDFRVIRHGLDILSMVPMLTTRVAERPHSPLVLAYVGTLIPQKGLHILIEALSMLPGAKIELRVMGARHGDPSYHQRIDSLMAADARVRWIGELPQGELFAALAACDLLCLPSQVPETYSLTFHEAAALGLPALVADHGAPAEVVRDAQCGICVPPTDVKAWAQAIQSVLDDRAVLAQWSKRLPLPARIEEEAFLYESLYRTVALLE